MVNEGRFQGLFNSSSLAQVDGKGRMAGGSMSIIEAGGEVKLALFEGGKR